MLHRAARNAYSWWWASHVRTKQSKWLDQNLQDMEEKVEYMLKIIEEDGDTFAQRAEMYYRKRPELINFVEDFFRGYRAIAERYDHLSRELQSANRTIASVFPESVQLSMDDDDFDGEILSAAEIPLEVFNQLSKKPPPVPQMSMPKHPSFARKKGKMPSRLMSKKGLLKINTDEAVVSVPVSGLGKSEALQKIDKLQKEILALQTEKEFVKSSYECGLEKYWSFEKHITELQAEVSNLQDEFGIGTVIEDDVARTLMTATALKSCQESLSRLQVKQEQSGEEADAESQKIQEAREKFRRLKGMFESNQTLQEERLHENRTSSQPTKDENPDQEMVNAEQSHQNVESLRRRIKEEVQVNLGTSFTMSELAEKVDEVVDKIINLESSVSSQSAHVKRLSSETNELQRHLQRLEEEKESLIEGSHGMSKKIKDLEEELQRVQSLNQCIKEKNHHLQAHFIEATCNLDGLSEKWLNVKPDEEAVEQIQYLHKMATAQEAQAVSQDVNTGEVDKHSEVGHNGGLLRDMELGSILNANPGAEAESNKDLESNQSQLPTNPEELFGDGEGEGGVVLEGTTMKQQKGIHNLENSSSCETDKDQRLPQLNKHHNIYSLLTAPDANPKTMTTRAIRKGMNDEVLEPSAPSISGKSMTPCNQGDHLPNQLRTGPVSDVHADSCESKSEQVDSNLKIEGHIKVEPVVDDLDLSSRENHTGSNPDKALPGERRQMEGEILGYSTIQSAAQTRSGSPDRERDDDHSMLNFVNSNRDVEEENNDILVNLSPAKSSNSQDSSLSIRHTSQERSNSKSYPPKDSLADEGISLPDNSSVSGDLKIVENPKENSFADQGKVQEEKQQNTYGTMERGVSTGEDELGVEEDDQLNWKELFLNGLDDREKLLLQEYTSVLRNYKEARKKLNEAEKKKRASLFQYCIQIKVLKSANASKDAKIQSLEKKLNLGQGNQDGTCDSRDTKTIASFDPPDGGSLIKDQKDPPVMSHDHSSGSDSMDAAERSAVQEQARISFIEDDGGIKVINIDKPHNPSIVEERIRTDIDELLEENIEFWMKFSSSFHQIQKFQTTVQDLKGELVKVKETSRQNGNTNCLSLISDIRPIYRHLSEIQTELTIWLDQNALLNDDLENRLSSLSGIQEEITRLSNSGNQVEETELTEYQAAKFHGEILNMKQENNKLADELHSGLEHVKILLVEIERTLKDLDAEFGVPTRKPQTRNPTSRSRIPLRTFLFGVKLKKQKPSIFACMSPSLQKQYSDLAALHI